ncbi:OmpA family protein [Spirosoma arcticum]
MFSSKTPWIILLAVWMMGATWWHVCQIKQLCSDATPQTSSSVNDGKVPSLLITDGNEFRLALPGDFSFAQSGANANMNTLMGSLDSLTAYLKGSGPSSRPGMKVPGMEVPGRTLTITGYYATDETNSTSFANLGLARAEGVKQYLVQQGVPVASITTKGAVRSKYTGLTFTPKGDSLYGALDFAFAGAAGTPMASMTVAQSAAAVTPLPATEEGLAAAERYTSVFEPINLYFPLGEANYIQTPETTKFFDEATKYLATHTDKKLLLTGHTDNSGPDAVNLRLSRDRANDVKVKLRRSGIGQNQIVVEAKGETAPKVPNNTREGRRANRRVTVVVQ